MCCMYMSHSIAHEIETVTVASVKIQGIETAQIVTVFSVIVQDAPLAIVTLETVTAKCDNMSRVGARGRGVM